MIKKPYQSVLIPYEEEIRILRKRRPPCSYARIAKILLDKHQIAVRRETIFKFVKVRTRGRKVYAIYQAPSPKKQKTLSTTAPAIANQKTLQTQPVWNFQYSERYNLTRLPPEEAAERRKKLDEEERQRLERYKSSKRIEPTWK